MQEIFCLDVTGHSMGEPQAMLETVGERLLAGFRKRDARKKDYAVHHVISSRAGLFTPHWDIYLTRGKYWRFKLAIEIFRSSEKLFFRISLGRNLDRSGTCLSLGMGLSLIGLLVASIDTSEVFNTNIILPVMIGTIIGGFILSLPIKLIFRPYVLMKAKKEGIEKDERRLVEDIKAVLRQVGHVV